MSEQTDLIFEEPPPTGRGNGPIAGQSPIGLWLASLRAHPGKWSKFPERVHASQKTQITRGRTHGVAPGEFEAVSRDSEKGRCWLYARYVGGAS